MERDKSPVKKLKWGLEDLSPLFQPIEREAVAEKWAPPVPVARPSFDIQFLSVCVPDHEGDAFLANAYVASQLVRQAHLYASLVSIAPGFNVLPPKTPGPAPSLELLDPKISRLSISHQELWALTQKPLGGERPQAPLSFSPEPFAVFLEFESAQFRSLARIAQLLDRVIFFIQPHADSLREAYRMIKVFSSLNRAIEFFLLFRGKLLPRHHGEFLFERFSLIASRFLGVSVGWLGDLAFPEEGKRSWTAEKDDFGFNPDPILVAEGLRRPLAPEQKRLQNWYGKILQNQISSAHS